jgi:hypothetical protein
MSERRGLFSKHKYRIWSDTECPTKCAHTLESAISRSWRVIEKISELSLSAPVDLTLSGDLVL